MNSLKKVAFSLSFFVIVTTLFGCSDKKVKRELISPKITQNSEDVWDGDIDETWFNFTDNEFHIKTAQEFAGLASLVNTGYETFINKKIIVDNNIYLNDVTDYDSWSIDRPDNSWTPIGINEYSFRGVIDFNNRLVQGMFIDWQVIDNNESNQNIGLFGSVKMKTPDSPVYISNLQLYNSFIAIPNQDTIVKNVGSVVGSITNGGIYGKLNGISNVISDCKIIASESSLQYVGGIVGFTQANVINCGYTGELLLKSCPAYVGGVAGGGAFPSFAINCYSTANISESLLKTVVAGTISYQCIPINCYYLKRGDYNKNHFAFGYVRRIEVDDNYKPYGNGTFENVDSAIFIPEPSIHYNGDSGLFGDNVKESVNKEYDNLLAALNSFSFRNYFTFNAGDDNQISKWTIDSSSNHGYPIHINEAK